MLVETVGALATMSLVPVELSLATIAVAGVADDGVVGVAVGAKSSTV